MEFFRVTNWDQYQHYKDRDPTWIKLYARLLDDYAFATLPDNGKWHLIGIFLLASKQGNRIPGDPRWVRKKIAARTRVDLESLRGAGFIEEDASTAPAEAEQAASPEKESESEERKEETLLSAGPDADESFEEFWKAYPTDPLMSKKKARGEWERLNLADRAAAIKTVPAFRDLCASRVNYRPVHAWRFLAERRFDGFMQPPPIDAAKIAEAKDRADRLLRRGKYAERYE
ncbi:MAG TPA: hypothetical protein VIG39_12520 [Rhizomicrobium sp.]|jgi:hypothetical protein